MQQPLFASHSTLDEQPAEARARVRHPWWKVERQSSDRGIDDFFPSTAPDVERFHSGASAYWDFRGFMLAEVPVGITATEVERMRRTRMVELVACYTESGGRVFVDSGAFGAFVAGRRLDFEADVFELLDALVSACERRDHLVFVMPDVVGNQVETLTLQRRYQARIRGWLNVGVECVFPLHSPGDPAFLREVWAIAGNQAVTIGVPSNLEAWSTTEVAHFCADVQPHRVHLLGLAKESRVRSLAERVAHWSPRTRLSCDSCSPIAHAGEGRRLTDRSRTRLAAAVVWIETTPLAETPFPCLSSFMTDVWYTPGFLNERQVEVIAEGLRIHAPSLLEASASEGLVATLGPLDPNEEWVHEALYEIVAQDVYRPWLRSQLRGPVRAWEVARLAGMVDEELEEAAAHRDQVKALLLSMAERPSSELQSSTELTTS